MPPTVRLPDFLFIGAAKCGTTWVFHALESHPQVFVPPAKDIYYFDRFYSRGPQWYASFFTSVPDTAAAVGELSLDYLYSADAARRIAADLPHVRLIVALRNPIDRAHSAYLFHKRNGTAARDFDLTAARWPQMVERGRYAAALRVYLDLFDRDRLNVLVFDDLVADPAGYARRLYEYLGVDPTVEYTQASRKVLAASRSRVGVVGVAAKGAAVLMRQAGMANLVGRIKHAPLVHRVLYKPLAAEHKEPLTPAQRDRLRDYYRDDVRELGRLLQRDFSHWLDDAPAPQASPAVP